MKRINNILLVALLGLLWMGCGPKDPPPPPAPAGPTAEQLEKGFGPIQRVDLTAVNGEMAAQGEAVFTTKCSACHKMDQRYVGPALGDIAARRSPEFIMNMILNPEEMIQKHPDVKAMLAQFMTPMPNQNLTEDEARAVLEYLRHVGEAGV